MRHFTAATVIVLFLTQAGPSVSPADRVPSLASLLDQPVPLKRGYDAAHPRLFFNRQELDRRR